MQRHWQTDWAVRVFAGFVQTDLDSVMAGLVGQMAKAEMSAELVDQMATVDLLAALVGQKVRDPTVLLARKETRQTVLPGQTVMHRIVPLEQRERY